MSKRTLIELVAFGILLLTLLWQYVPGVAELPGRLLPENGNAATEILHRDWARMWAPLSRILPAGPWPDLVLGLFQASLVCWLPVALILLVLSKRVWQPRAQQHRGVAFEVTLPSQAPAGARAQAGFLTRIHALLPKGGLRNGLHAALELVYADGQVHFVLWGPAQYEETFRRALEGSFPSVRLAQRDVLRECVAALPGEEVLCQDYELTGDPCLPLRTDFQDGEPLDVLLAALQPPPDSGVAVTAISIVLRPAPGSWRRATQRLIAGIKASAGQHPETKQPLPLEPYQREQIAALEVRLRDPGYDTVVRVMVAGGSPWTAAQQATLIGGALSQFSSTEGGALQQFALRRQWTEAAPTTPAPPEGQGRGRPVPRRAVRGKGPGGLSLVHRPLPPYLGAILPFGLGRRRMSLQTSRELAHLWQPPGKQVHSPLVARGAAAFLRHQAQAVLQPGEFFVDAHGRPVPTATRLALGEAEEGGQYVGPTRYEDILQHGYILGPTGSGKTELLKFIVQQHLRLGPPVGGPFGCALLDAKGPGFAELAECVPLARERDVIWMDPHEDWVVPFNVLDWRRMPTLAAREVAEAALAALEVAVGGLASTALGMREVLYHALAAVTCGDERPTLLKAFDFIRDGPHGEQYRRQLMEKIREVDPEVAEYFDTDYRTRPVQESAIAARRRFRGLLFSDHVRPLLASEESGLDVLEIMDQGKILLAKVGRDLKGAQKIIGALLLQNILEACDQRYRQLQSGAGNRPRLFLLAVDEFQNFARLEGIEPIVSMMRGAGISAWFMHQVLEQVPDAILAPLLGNVGTKIIFPLRNDEDARRIAGLSGGRFSKDDLLRAAPYHPYVTAPGQDWYGLVAQQPLDLAAEQEEEQRRVAETRGAVFTWPRGRPRDELDDTVERLRALPWQQAAALLVTMPAERYQEVLRRVYELRQARADFLVANPGAIPVKRDRIREMSLCRYGRWRAEIVAQEKRQGGRKLAADAVAEDVPPSW